MPRVVRSLTRGLGIPGVVPGSDSRAGVSISPVRVCGTYLAWAGGYMHAGACVRARAGTKALAGGHRGGVWGPFRMVVKRKR